MLTEMKPEYFDILYNPTHFPGPLVCRIRQIPLYSDVKVDDLNLRFLYNKKGCQTKLQEMIYT